MKRIESMTIKAIYFFTVACVVRFWVALPQRVEEFNLTTVLTLAGVYFFTGLLVYFAGALIFSKKESNRPSSF